MVFYFVSDTHRSLYRKTLAEAHAEAKMMARFHVIIEKVDVGTDAENMLRLLNGEGGTQRTLRAWSLSPRGGLMANVTCPTCGSVDIHEEGDRFRCDCGATWFAEEKDGAR